MELTKNLTTKTDRMIVPGWLTFDLAVEAWNKHTEGIPYVKYLLEKYKKFTLIADKKPEPETNTDDTD